MGILVLMIFIIVFVEKRVGKKLKNFLRSNASDTSGLSAIKRNMSLFYIAQLSLSLLMSIFKFT